MGNERNPGGEVVPAIPAADPLDSFARDRRNGPDQIRLSEMPGSSGVIFEQGPADGGHKFQEKHD
jgi:hypothetical protein